MGTFADTGLSKRERDVRDYLPRIADSGSPPPDGCVLAARLLGSHSTAPSRLDASGPREVRENLEDFPGLLAKRTDPLLATPGAGTIGDHPANPLSDRGERGSIDNWADQHT